MFLIEGGGKRILYTGDIRAEQWWVDALMRLPAMAAYAAGMKVLDKVYLDTTFAVSDGAYRAFPPKAVGIQDLIRQIAACSEETVFHLKAWTLGYEEVFAAIATAFDTKVSTLRTASHKADYLRDSRRPLQG
jgi:DNA cross-link repair 1C protein